MPPLAPNVSQTGLLRTQSGWNNSSQSRRSNTTRGLLSTRTPQSMDTSSGGLLNPPLPPSALAEAMPRGATGSFRPRISLRRPDTGLVLGYVLNRVTGQRTFTGRNILAYDLNDVGNYVGGQLLGAERGLPIHASITSSSSTLLSRTVGATTYPYGFATRISFNGKIVGVLKDDDGNTLLAYWDTASVDPVLLSQSGYIAANSNVTGINNGEKIVGYANQSIDNKQKPLYWANRGVPIPSVLSLVVSPTTYDSGRAWGINSNGNIIGFVEDIASPIPPVPAYWTGPGASDLTTLSLVEGPTTYDSGQARDINNATSPEIVGYVLQTGASVPAYWAGTGAGDLKTLSLTDGTNSYTQGYASGINDDGVIVGWVITTDGGPLPVYWVDKDTNLILLPTSGLLPLSFRGEVITNSERILVSAQIEE